MHNHYVRYIQAEPELLELKNILESNPYAKMISSGFRLRRAAIEYPNILEGSKEKNILVVDETRQSSRYSGKSIHVKCNRMVLESFLKESKGVINTSLGLVRSDLCEHVEKVLKIRILNEFVVLSTLYNESVHNTQQETNPLTNQNDDIQSPVFQSSFISKLKDSNKPDLKKYTIIIRFKNLSTKAKNLDMNYITSSFTGPEALNSSLINEIYNSVSTNIYKPEPKPEITNEASIMTEGGVPEPNEKHVYDIDEMFGSETAKLVLYTILTNLYSKSKQNGDGIIVMEEGKETTEITIKQHLLTIEIFVQFFRLKMYLQ
ncbi:hypothetical protein BB558_001529 [Smittium angustum]|uniref:Uncharacterized protein n=1 Tax=Smittium angustum TaxID=133377 RepID=A0A2U1JB46_SMIAN|nr:hypothetical protein BB558_001529 [Smittium angustum]